MGAAIANKIVSFNTIHENMPSTNKTIDVTNVVIGADYKLSQVASTVGMTGSLPKQIEDQLEDIKKEIENSDIHDLIADPHIELEKSLKETREFLNEFLVSGASYQFIYEVRRGFIPEVRSEIIPEIMFLDGGGIGLEWRPDNGIITVSIYGDANAHIVVLINDYEYDISAKIPLSDKYVLFNVLRTLNHLLQKGVILEDDIHFRQWKNNPIYFREERSLH